MECFHPVTINNPNFGLYGEYRVLQVPCGKCPACQQTRRKLWFFRLKVESDRCVVSYCVTLTYNDLDVPDYTNYEDKFQYHPICYEDLQKFNKRLRKRIGPFRFFAVCEYGSKGLRPHFHVCYFFDRPVSEWDFHNAVFELWFPQSRITIDTTNERACSYILKYCLRPSGEEVPDEFRPKIVCSTKPYIGSGFLQDPRVVRDFKESLRDFSHYLGYWQRLPRIYRDKLFTDEEKRFISKELEQLVFTRQDEQAQKDLEYMTRHPGCELPSVMRRRSFQRHIENCAKLKSLK